MCVSCSCIIVRTILTFLPCEDFFSGLKFSQGCERYVFVEFWLLLDFFFMHWHSLKCLSDHSEAATLSWLVNYKHFCHRFIVFTHYPSRTRFKLYSIIRFSLIWLSVIAYITCVDLNGSELLVTFINLIFQSIWILKLQVIISPAYLQKVFIVCAGGDGHSTITDGASWCFRCSHSL